MYIVYIQVNGNDYEHIWQTPLPIPRRTSTEKSPPSSPQSVDTTGGGEGVGVGGTGRPNTLIFYNYTIRGQTDINQ